MVGIYNPALFQAADRKARDNLSRMGGIMSLAPRPSAPAPAPTPRPMMPQPMPMMMPMMAPQPMMMPMSPAPMAAPVAPRPVAPQPMQQPQPAPIRMRQGGPVRKMQEGGEVRPSRIQAVPTPVDISQDPFTFAQGLLANVEALRPEALPMVQNKVSKIATAYASDDQEMLKQELTSAVGVENNKAGLEKVYAAATGETAPKNASIDELNNRIMTVALGGALASPGSTAERFAKAMLFGLGQLRDTEIARASAKAGIGGAGVSPLEPYPDAVRELAGRLIQQNLAEDATEAVRMAEDALRPLYQGGVMPSTAPAPAAETAPAAPAGGPVPTLEEFLVQARSSPQNKGFTDQQLIDYYNKKYGG
jgi:hypothetical protein